MIKQTVAVVTLFMLSAPSALAFCTWGFPPLENEYQPLNATEVFISYADGVQTMVLKPEWQGNAEEFGIVYPTPAKPTVEEGPTDLFWQLEDATNPWVPTKRDFGDDVVFLETAAMDAEETVTVVEEKQVGEYDVAILTATDADDLVEWLADEDYNYSDNDAAKVAYYVEQGGFYFIALKVNAEDFEKYPRPLPVEPDGGIGDGAVPLDELIARGEVEIDEIEGELIMEDSEPQALTIAPDWFWGELSPLEISFATDMPQLPMRTLKSDMPEMTFDLYTLADTALYIPGVDTIWSDVVDVTFLGDVPALNDYDPKAKWLVRQEVNFNPANSDADLFLTTAPEGTFTIVTAGTQVRFDPADLPSETGIIAGNRGQVVHTDGSGSAYTFSRSLTIGSVGEDVRELQRILNTEGFTVAAIGPGSVGNESSYFGNLTKQALIKYQNFYRADILEPVGLSQGTGYFGPSTINFINR